MKEDSRKYLLGSIVAVVLVSIGATYAYWQANINGEGANVSVTFGDVNIIFTDTQEIVETDASLPWSTSKTFTIQNEGTQEFFYDINIKELVNTLVTDRYLQYRIISTNGYNMTEYAPINKSATASTQTLGNYIRILGNTTQEYTIEFRYVEDPDVDQSEDMGKSFSGKLEIVEAVLPTLYDKLLADNPTRTGQRPNNTLTNITPFADIYTTENTGTMYVASGNQTEDGSNVYYFAGNAKNNWIKFGKDSTGADLYWRIIRTNEDGSVRMLYAGTSPSTTSGYITGTRNDGTTGSTTWYGSNSSTYDHPKYVGYMYGDSGNTLANARTNETSSGIKTMIDNWYRDGLNIKTDANGNIYDKYISQTAIYCNDRAHEEAYSINSTFYFAAYKRLIDAKSPSYKCGNDASGNLYSTAGNADKFSKNTSKGGNGNLTYPIALMTADEVSFAGGLWNTKAPAWYYYNSGNESITGRAYWWTMSPVNFYNNYAGVFSVVGSDISGYLDWNYVHRTRGVRPVVSLKSCVLTSGGNGSSSTPYIIQINSICANAKN